uniref:Uncharacterized protein n=1 Tax=Stomoxys calcitrans TaxID=35570 RepID=A0A1I8NXR4_STOCA
MSVRSYIGREKFNVSLIKEVQKYTVLYDHAHPDFRNSFVKLKIWQEIGRTLGESEHLCKVRWVDLRKQYSKEYQRMRAPSNVRNTYWRYTEALSFLKEYETHKVISPQEPPKVAKRDVYCRACLCPFQAESGGTKSHNIFEISDLAKKLSECSGREVVEWDEYPQSVCEKCYKKIIYFAQFRDMCRSSLEKFNTIIHDPKEVAYDLNETIKDDSLNFTLEVDADLNTLLENEETYKVKNTKKRKNKLEPEKIRVPEVKPELELDNEIMDEIIQVEIERNADCDEQSSGVDTAVEHLPTEEPLKHIVEDENIEDMFNEETLMEDAEYLIEEEKYIVEELQDEEESVSEPSIKRNVKPKRKHNQNCLKCNICSSLFRFQHRLDAHVRQHQGLHGYPCTFEGCKRAFQRIDDFRAHINDHNGISNEFICGIENCDKVFSTKYLLKRHKRNQHFVGVQVLANKKKYPPRHFVCEICGRVVSSRAALLEHGFVHVDKSLWPYACDEEGCTRRFRILSHLKIHKNRHAGIRNYVCPYCNERKTTRTELTIHINGHTFERKYTCHICLKVFKCAGTLNVHIRRVHAQKEILECRFCSHKCSTPHYLRYHESTHTGEDPYPCQQCGKQFPTASGRHTHMQVHTKGEHPHICSECGKSFRWASSLKYHHQ